MESLTGSASESVTSICRNGDVSETVVGAVARATGVDPLELEPLYNVVDPDALNTLVESTSTSPPTSMELSFTMAGCQVVVHGDGEVAVAPPEDADENPAVIDPSEE